jgi:excisionase family DNA binding protein
MDRATLTVKEAAKLLGIGRNSAYEAAHRGEIPAVRIGRRLVVSRAALDRLLGAGAMDPRALEPGGTTGQVDSVALGVRL